jgi:hypothetical protein
VHRDVPWSSAVYLNVSDRKKTGQEIFGSRHGSNGRRSAGAPPLFNRSCPRAEQVSGKVKRRRLRRLT